MLHDVISLSHYKTTVLSLHFSLGGIFDFARFLQANDEGRLSDLSADK